MRRSSRVTVRLSTYWTRNIALRNHIAAKKLQRQAISAKGMAGRRNMSRKPSAVGEGELMLDGGATAPNYCSSSATRHELFPTLSRRTREGWGTHVYELSFLLAGEWPAAWAVL